MADPNQELRESVTNLNNAMTQFANSLTTLQNAVNNMAAAGPPAAVFSTTPGTTRVDALLDYGSRWGLAVYEQGTKGLYERDEDKFDTVNGSPIDVIVDYGRITMADLKTQSESFYLDTLKPSVELPSLSTPR